LTLDFNIRISVIDAGNLRNAIAREGYATFAVSEAKGDSVIQKVKEYELVLKNELAVNAPDLKVEIESVQTVDFLIDMNTQLNLLNALYACPHGVIAWSASIPVWLKHPPTLPPLRPKKRL